MSVDPHAKVTSVEQDNWVELADLLRRNLLRLAMQPNLTIEDIRAIRVAAFEIKSLHVLALAFDAQLEATIQQFTAQESSQ